MLFAETLLGIVERTQLTNRSRMKYIFFITLRSEKMEAKITKGRWVAETRNTPVSSIGYHNIYAEVERNGEIERHAIGSIGAFLLCGDEPIANTKLFLNAPQMLKVLGDCAIRFRGMKTLLDYYEKHPEEFEEDCEQFAKWCEFTIERATNLDPVS